MINTIRYFVFWICLISGLNIADAQKFYKNEYGLFSTRPSESSSLQTIKRFGPVGMGIDLIQPAFTMRVSHIENGSPAAATGKLKTGQIIETINGQELADIDPRIQLGQVLDPCWWRLCFKEVPGLPKGIQSGIKKLRKMMLWNA